MRAQVGNHRVIDNRPCATLLRTEVVACLQVDHITGGDKVVVVSAAGSTALSVEQIELARGTCCRNVGIDVDIAFGIEGEGVVGVPAHGFVDEDVAIATGCAHAGGLDSEVATGER